MNRKIPAILKRVKAIKSSWANHQMDSAKGLPGTYDDMPEMLERFVFNFTKDDGRSDYVSTSPVYYTIFGVKDGVPFCEFGTMNSIYQLELIEDLINETNQNPDGSATSLRYTNGSATKRSNPFPL